MQGVFFFQLAMRINEARRIDESTRKRERFGERRLEMWHLGKIIPDRLPKGFRNGPRVGALLSDGCDGFSVND